VATGDVEDAISWAQDTYLPEHYSSEWNGTLVVIGSSAGGTLVLQALADYATAHPTDPPLVPAFATWSAKFEMASFDSDQAPDDGYSSYDTCDHANGYVPPAADIPNWIRNCWNGLDHYFDSFVLPLPAGDPVPLCGFPIDPDTTDIDPNQTENCADPQPWEDASPYTTWAEALRDQLTLPPVFFANGGGPNENVYANSELVPLKEANDFEALLQQFPSTTFQKCIVDGPHHDGQYVYDYSCEGETDSVFKTTMDFLAQYEG